MTLFSPIKHTRASSDVIAQIRAAILSGQFHPGDRLPTEREMAEQFGVSRVTVRDALRTLEASGLIRIKVGSQGGPFVAEPDIATLSDSLGTHLLRSGTTFREVAEARLALETTAARLAAERSTDEDLARIRAAIPGPEEQPPDAATMSLDFHAAVVEASHNRALSVIYQAIRSLIQEGFGTLRAHQSLPIEISRQVHEELYQAIAGRDADRAVRIMREHLYDFLERAERTQVRLRATWGVPERP